VPESQPARPAPTPAAKPQMHARHGRLMLLAYLLLIFGTVIAINLPRFRLKAGLGEEALVILSITAMLIGAGLALWNIIRSNLRQLQV
jgi:hypothetical protein